MIWRGILRFFFQMTIGFRLVIWCRFKMGSWDLGIGLRVDFREQPFLTIPHVPF
jgi:hypothetical protein